MKFNRPIRPTRSNRNPGLTGPIFRPDLWWDLGTHGLVVEVDENQHVTYGRQNEAARTLQLQVDAQKPVVFLRFNPDGFRDSSDVLHSSCFKKPARSLAFESQRHREQRLSFPMERLVMCKNVRPDQDVTVEKLFYDGHTACSQLVLCDVRLDCV